MVGGEEDQWQHPGVALKALTYKSNVICTLPSSHNPDQPYVNEACLEDAYCFMEMLNRVSDTVIHLSVKDRDTAYTFS